MSQLDPRTYTVHDATTDQPRTYTGFNRHYKPQRMELVALVQVEDTVEVFVLDDTKQARTEFIRFLSEQDQYAHATICGVYHRGK